VASARPATYFDGSGQDRRRDGYVSIEVDPHPADDAQATINEATLLHEAIDMEKLPSNPSDTRGDRHDRGDDRSWAVHQRHHVDLLAVPAPPGDRGLPPRARAACRHRRRPESRSLSGQFSRSRVWARRSTAVSTSLGRGDLKERLGIAKSKLVYQQYKERLRRLAHFRGTRRNQAALPLGVDVSKKPRVCSTRSKSRS
jgi:hypothetical protein